MLGAIFVSFVDGNVEYRLKRGLIGCSDVQTFRVNRNRESDRVHEFFASRFLLNERTFLFFRYRCCYYCHEVFVKTVK